MLTQRLVALMQRLVEVGATSTPSNKTSDRLISDFGLGRLKGKTILFSERELVEIRELLQARGHAPHSVDLARMTRAERLQSGSPNEKAGGGTIKNHRISIKATAGQPLCVAGRQLFLPARSHLDTDWTALADVEHNCIMLVENYEDFDRLDDHRFDLPQGLDRPLAIYRGDRHESRQDNVVAYLNASSLPVIAFVDVDPRGLHIAQCCPRLHGVVAPPRQSLTEVLSNAASARPDLYISQVAALENVFATLPRESPVFAIWQLIQGARAGAVQERWRSNSLPCCLWRYGASPK